MRPTLAAILMITILLVLVNVTDAQSVSVSWQDNSDNENAFLMERQTNGGSFFEVATISANIQTWQDTQVLVNSTYCYRVRAVNAVGASDYSNTACLTVPDTGVTAAVMLGCTYTPTPPLPPSLVLAFHFDEPSGSAVLDSSGQNNNGVISGATRTTAGRYGAALLFDGVNDWVTVADANTLDLTTGMTLEAWVYPTVALSGWRTILAKEQLGGVAYFLHASSLPNNQPATGVFISGAERQLIGVSTLPVNVWTHLAMSYDNGMQRLYVNGIEIASRVQTGAVTV